MTDLDIYQCGAIARDGVLRGVFGGFGVCEFEKGVCHATEY